LCCCHSTSNRTISQPFLICCFSTRLSPRFLVCRVLCHSCLFLQSTIFVKRRYLGSKMGSRVKMVAREEDSTRWPSVRVIFRQVSLPPHSRLIQIIIVQHVQIPGASWDCCSLFLCKQVAADFVPRPRHMFLDVCHHLVFSAYDTRICADA